MSQNRDSDGDTPTGERIAGIRAHMERLRARLHELQRDAPQPPPPLPPPPAAPVDEPAGTRLAQPPPALTEKPQATPATPMAVPMAASTSPDVSLTAPTAAATPSMPWTPTRRARNGFQLALHLAQRPGFCCCCLCLGPRDAKRAKRIFALVRAIKRAERRRAG